MNQSRESPARKRASAARAARRHDVTPPVGSTGRVLRVEGQVARLRLRPDRSHGAKMLYRCAIVVGLGTALLALSVDDELWWGELVALMFLGMGVLFGSSDRETRLNFEHKLVFRGKGDSVAGGIPFADLVGILATARTALVQGDQNSYEERRFVLGLLVADAAAPLRETLLAMRRDRVAALREGHEPASDDASPRLDGPMQAHVLAVVDYTDETAVWEASEWLAEKLDLPLIDACSSPTVVRFPEELELSLGERLARGLQPINVIADVTADVTAAYSSAPAPAGASVEWQSGKLTLSWRENRRFDFFMAVGMALLFPALALVLFRDDKVGFWMSTGFGLCLLPLSLNVARWHGANQLTVDEKRVIVTRGPFGKRLPPLATDSVEAVRVGGTSGYPLLSLVSDQRVLKIRMAPALARWAKQHIERQLLVVRQEKSKLADRGEQAQT